MSLTLGLVAALMLSMKSPSLVASLCAADPPITAITFAPGGKQVLTGSQAGLTVHDWPTLEPVRHFNTAVVNIHDLKFSAAGDRLAIAGGTPGEQGLVEMVKWPSGELVSRCEEHADSVLAAAWRSPTELATAGLDHDVRTWDLSGTAQQRFAGHSRGVTTLCFLPEDILVTAGLDQNLRVWNLQTGEMIRTLNNHTRPVHQVSLRPAQAGLPMVASVSDDRTVRLWQPTIGRLVRFAKLETAPLAIEWLPDGSRMVVAVQDGHVHLIDPDTVETVAVKKGVQGWAYALAVHPNESAAVVGGRQGQLQKVLLNIEQESEK